MMLHQVIVMNGTCRTSLVSPKQSVLSILVWPSNAAYLACHELESVFIIIIIYVIQDPHF